jgi:dihydroflavonol-4-reductase
MATHWPQKRRHRSGSGRRHTVTTLITGATGFVGSHLVRQLVSRGDPVRVLVRPTSPLGQLAALDVEVARGDLRDPAAVRAAVRGVRRVFHVGADYRLSVRDPNAVYETNVLGTHHVLASIDAGVERVVYTSTVATIAVPRDRLPDENTEGSLDEMIGDYKRSKLMAERAVREAARQGAPIVIVNPTTPVGPGDWRPTPTGQVIVDFLAGRMPAYLQTGLNIVPVEDVARGHILAAEQGRIGERYLLGGPNMTFKALLDTLATVSGQPAPRLRLPWRAAMAIGFADQFVAHLRGRDPRIPLDGVRMARHSMWVNCTKAEHELGFVPGPIDGALQRAVDWYRQHGYVQRRIGHAGRSEQCSS